MKNIEEEIKEYIDEKLQEEIGDPHLEDLKALFRSKKNVRTKNIKFWKRFAICTCMIAIIVPSVAIPLALSNPPADPDTGSTPAVTTPVTPPAEEEKYYSAEDTTKITLTNEELSTYFNENFSQFNFFFEDAEIQDISGYTVEDNLLLINFQISRLNEPYAKINVNFVTNNRYTFEDHSQYIDNVEPEEYENYTLYMNQTGTALKKTYLRLYDYENYAVYLKMNREDSTFLNNF